jgi:hypothetical protein
MHARKRKSPICWDTKVLSSLANSSWKNGIRPQFGFRNFFPQTIKSNNNSRRVTLQTSPHPQPHHFKSNQVFEPKPLNRTTQVKMLYTQAVIALISAFAVLAAAVPTAPGAIQHIQLHNGTNYTISPIDFSNENEAQIDVLKKRKEGSDWERDGEITSCYHHGGWIPRQNHGDEYWDGTGYRGGKYWGYISAVEEFCRRVTYPSEHQGTTEPIVTHILALFADALQEQSTQSCQPGTA